MITLVAVEAGNQGYQLAQLTQDQQPEIYIIVVVNVYAMVLEAIIIFKLSDFWHNSGSILSKQSTEAETE